jgi:hypothetical protein
MRPPKLKNRIPSGPPAYSRSKAWIAYSLVSLAFLTFCGLFFMPELVSNVWHLFHGSSAKFHGWVVPVPRGWWAFERDGTLVIQKMQREAGDDSVVVLAPMVFDQNKGFEYEKWKGAIAQTKIGEGYQFLTEYKITLDNQEGFCLSFAKIKNNTRLSITCIVPGRHVFLEFYGDKAWSSSFDTIIEHVKTNVPMPSPEQPSKPTEHTRSPVIG